MSKPNEVRLRNITRQTTLVTVATLVLSAFRFGGMRLLNCQRAAGQSFTLPKATGKAGKYRFYIGTSITSNSTIIKANGTDTINGVALVTGATPITAASASNTNTITFNGSTTGGLLGSTVLLEDVGLGQWAVEINAIGSGTAATPFSNS